MIYGNTVRTACLTIDSALPNVALIGLAVKGICSQLPFDEQTSFQLELGVVEAVTNVIKHAYQGQPGQEVRVVLRVGPDQLQVTITDQGKPGLCLEVLPPAFDPADRAGAPESGFGLMIINSVMDAVEYNSGEGGNTLRMSKRFPARPEERR